MSVAVVIVLIAVQLGLMRLAFPHRRRTAAAVSWGAAPIAPTAARERLAWFGGATNRALALGAWLLVAALLAVAALFADALVALIAIPLVLVALELARVHVVVGAEGASIGFGHSGLLAQRIELSRIRRARAGRVERLGPGGYGLQDDPEGSRLLIGRGECLGLELEDGSAWVVSARDAEEAARVVNGLLARRRS